MLMHKILGRYNLTHRYENQCMDNFSGLLEDNRWGKVSSYVSDTRLPSGNVFLVLELVLPSTSLEQQAKVKTEQKRHLHKTPLFAAFTKATRGRITALPWMLHNLLLPLKLSSWLPSVPKYQPTRSFCHMFLFVYFNYWSLELWLSFKAECKGRSHSFAKSPLDDNLNNLST